MKLSPLKPNNSNKPKGRIIQHIKLRTALRYRVIGASIFLLLAAGLVLFIHFTIPGTAVASANGDFRTKATGNWNSATTWQKMVGGAWVNAPAAPTSADGVITILNTHTVTVTANVTVDQVVINSGGQVTLNSGITLTVANGTGTDFDVSGIFKNAGTVTINASATIAYQSGGKYQHNFTTTAGTIPTATWNTGSICEIVGYTTNTAAPAGLQSFYDFTWNCPSQTAVVNLGGGLTTVSNTFTVTTTNTGQLALATNGSTLAIGGDYIQSGGTFVLSTANAQTSTVNLTGNYTQSGGTFSVVNGTGSTGNLNVSGNWTHTGGTLTIGGNAATNAQVYFNKAGQQTFSSGGATVTGNVDFTVNSGSTLVMATNILTGRNFTLSSGAGLFLGATAGITSSGATGNIQVSGTRTFNTGGDYTYYGAAAQTTGNGLPGTVHNLTVNNSNGLTLTGSTAVSNVVTFTAGNILTGANELRASNTAAAALTGYSATSYVVGNLRRSVSGSGIYDFPLGTSANYELATITLASTTGFTDLLGSFTNTNPVAAGFPLVGTLLSNLLIDKALSYGYWTLTPNTALTGGTYSVMAYETGNAVATGPSYSYCVLIRSTVSSSWQSTGTHIQGNVSGATLSAGRSGMNSFGDYCIGYGQYLGFKNVSLISGTDGMVNAIYKFPDVCYNIDCWIQIMSLDGGATLSSIDNYSVGNGYDEAWQPYVNQPAGGTSSILWKLTFKTAGTANDTIIPFLAITGIDVDGAAGIKEFVEATMPKSYALGSPTTLTVTNNNGNYRATSSNAGIANIDTGQYQAMYQINYQNLNNFLYRTGAINTTGGSVVRQHSLYFKSFFVGQLALPVRLVYFKANLNSKHKVDLNWATSSEINNDHFTVERSGDGENFEAILNKPGAGTSTVNRYYNATDENPLPGNSYYRLKQTDYDGHITYSETQSVNFQSVPEDQSTLKITSVSPNPFSEEFTVSFVVKTATEVDLQLVNSSGQVIFKDHLSANEGMNHYDFADKNGLQKGIYFLNLVYNNEKQVQKIVKN